DAPAVEAELPRVHEPEHDRSVLAGSPAMEVRGAEGVAQPLDDQVDLEGAEALVEVGADPADRRTAGAAGHEVVLVVDDDFLVPGQGGLEVPVVGERRAGGAEQGQGQGGGDGLEAG